MCDRMITDQRVHEYKCRHKICNECCSKVRQMENVPRCGKCTKQLADTPKENESASYLLKVLFGRQLSFDSFQQEDLRMR